MAILSSLPGYPWNVGSSYCKHIRWISYLERDSVTQIVMVCSLPILFYTIPQAVGLYLPLICSGLIVSIVHQKMREAELSEKIVKQNQELEKICKSFQDIAKGLEDAISSCLKVTQQKDAVIAAIDQMDVDVDKRLEQVKTRILTLSAICQKAQSEESVLQLMATVQTSEARLTELTQETRRLNQQIGGIIKELQTYVPQIGKHDAEMQKKAAILTGLIEKWERRENVHKSNC